MVRIDLAKLSPEERLHLMDEIWESLTADPATIPVTQAQREELDRRFDDLERDGPMGIPWTEVLSRIRSL